MFNDLIRLGEEVIKFGVFKPKIGTETVQKIRRNLVVKQDKGAHNLFRKMLKNKKIRTHMLASDASSYNRGSLKDIRDRVGRRIKSSIYGPEDKRAAYATVKKLNKRLEKVSKNKLKESNWAKKYGYTKVIE